MLFLIKTSALCTQHFWKAKVFKLRGSTGGFTRVWSVPWVKSLAKTPSTYTLGTAEVGQLDLVPLVFWGRAGWFLEGGFMGHERGGSTEENEGQLLRSQAFQGNQAWPSSLLLDDHSRGRGDIYSKAPHFLIKATIENIHHPVVGGRETFLHLLCMPQGSWKGHIPVLSPPTWASFEARWW